MATKVFGKANISAIYVHAGAGFHSRANERHHLECCEEAAKVAMALLNNGGSAVDAVEIAIRFMEDRESTNAGYGSNLNIDGIVENDACIVNHLGRSGACGAVPRVKNPISLARAILDDTYKPLLMRRVPPNFLVGQGAIQFARDSHIPVLLDEFLISPSSRARWNKWRQDLQLAREKEIEKLQNPSSDEEDEDPISNDEDAQLAENSPDVKDYKDNTMTFAELERVMQKKTGEGSDTSLGEKLRGMAPPDMPRSGPHWPEHPEYLLFEDPVHSRITKLDPPMQITGMPRSLFSRRRESQNPRVEPAIDSKSDDIKNDDTKDVDAKNDSAKDNVTDTVGAIAVDCFGNIAAGSSSGGIGMKHPGRIGPAALVGIGTAVIPVNPLDSEKTCVAVVASGTGEHIATATAAGTCASRIYFSNKVGDNSELEAVPEEEALRSMIENEFAGHPGVLGVTPELDDPCIGLMAVKKTRDAVFLYFAHNSESFALASMCSEDDKPSSVMSRSFSKGSVAQGGRVSRTKRYKVKVSEHDIEKLKPQQEQKGFHIADAGED